MRDHVEPLNHHVMDPVGYALSLKHDPGERGVARGRASPSSEIRDFGGGSHACHGDYILAINNRGGIRNPVPPRGCGERDF